MGSGASAETAEKITSASADELKEFAAGLDEEQRSKIAAALATNGASAAAGLIDVTGLKYPPTSDDGLEAQPADPKYKVGLVGMSVPSLTNGGSDKLLNGHRFDTVAVANGMIRAGCSCQIIYYDPENHDEFMKVAAKFDGLIIRVNPGQVSAAGGDQKKFDDAFNEIAKEKPVFPSPDLMGKMGAKDALCRIKDMDFGLTDTDGYYSPDDMKTLFKRNIAFAPRVVKQNRGSAGEGIWIVNLKSGEYCSELGGRIAEDTDVLTLKEANDNHVEEHTVAEFIEFCTNGRTEAAGTWTSVGKGQYYEGGVEAGGQMVDQRFLPRIEEGEARFMMVRNELFRIEHYKYIGGVGGETVTTIYPPDAPEFAETKAKLEKDVPEIMKRFGLTEDALPLLWATDFIPIDKHPTPYVVGEFNCSCLGIAGYLNIRGKSLSDLSEDDKKLGDGMTTFIGTKALEAFNKHYGK